MVNNSAVISVIDKLTRKRSAPCKKTLQKIVYLIESKNVDLGCDYGIHFYGPYSADLDFAVRELSEEGVLKINYTPTEHTISIIDTSVYPMPNNPVIDEVINEFGAESPSELELLATALYIYLQTKDETKVKSGVIKIKGDKYSESKIDSAIARLKKSRYIAA